MSWVSLRLSGAIFFVSGSIGCTGAGVVGDTSITVEDEDVRSDSGETGSAIVWDRDQDGFSEDEDCNDYDADVYPGAPEVWNAFDDDCNGRVDADGLYTGNLDVNGSVVIEGIETTFSVLCPTEMTRSQATLDLLAVCTPSEADAIAVLGEELLLQVVDSGLSGDTWSGRGELRSSQGWDTSLLEVAVSWQEFSRAEIEGRTSSSMASLALTGSGELLVVGDEP